VKNVRYSDGKISFTSANTTKGGNAVIVLKNGSTVLWSWHIWMNAAFNASNDQEYGTGSYYEGKVKMMPYNLGAVNTTNTAVATNAFDDGLLYQWGRKDPFLSGVGYTANTYPTKGLHYYYEGSGDFINNGGTEGTVDLAYKNPTRFYRGTTERSGDWSDTQYDNLWGNGSGSGYEDGSSESNKEFGVKTLFDPCPPGYKVPPRNTWSTNFTTASVYGITFNKGYAFKYKGTTATSFYSASGDRSADNANLYRVGSGGTYWSSSRGKHGYRGGGAMTFQSGNVVPLSNLISSGGSVRCAQIK
jgi:hypothetical protein